MQSLGHVALVVRDYDEALAFFTRTLNFRVVEDFSRHCLMNGLDDIGLTLEHEAQIAAYEAEHPVLAEMKGILAR